MSLRQEVHDRLRGAFDRWQALRGMTTKFELKMRGLREHQDPPHFLRPLIFTGETLRSYDAVLKEFVAFAEREFGITRLEEIGKRVFRAFMDQGIEQGLAAKTLHRHRSALAKLGALIGHSQSAAAVSKAYGRKIRELVSAGRLLGPARATPSPQVVQCAIEILRDWDARHFARTDEPRAYHLAARLQLETSCRRVSATTRVSADSLLKDNQVRLAGKGGRVLPFTLSPELYGLLCLYLRHNPGPLADADGYRVAYGRAMRVVGGQVTGTHGLRRLSAQMFYGAEYDRRLSGGASPAEARQGAREEAVERLGHSRNRTDQAACYLGPAAKNPGLPLPRASKKNLTLQAEAA